MKSMVFVISSLSGGGAERVLSNLANHFAQNRYKVDILYTAPYKKSVYPLCENITIHPLPTDILFNKKKFNTFKNMFLTILHLRKKIKELNPDIVISFLDVTNIYTIIAHFGLKIPLIISERSNYHFLQSKVWRIIRRVVYPFTDGMVVLSKYDFDKYHFVKNKKIIFNPIKIDENAIVDFDKKEKVIISVGRLDQNKGFDKLIVAISRLEINDWRVLILGEGPERENLNHLIKEYKLEEKVFLLGRKNNIENYYKKASIFVLSSRYEGFPNALAEAMSFGCACVSFDCLTGPSDIIQNDINGILVEEGNIELLSKNINLLIGDSSLRERYFNEAIKIRDKLSIQNIAQEWEKYINQIKGKV